MQKLKSRLSEKVIKSEDTKGTVTVTDIGIGIKRDFITESAQNYGKNLLNKSLKI